MNALRWLALSTLALNCAHRERPSPSAAGPAPTPIVAVASASPAMSTRAGASATPAAGATPAPRTLDRRGIGALIAAANEVVEVELVQWDAALPAQRLSAADREHFVALLRGGAAIDGQTVAHPPWPAGFVIKTRSQGAYTVTLVGPSNLRLHSAARDARVASSAPGGSGAPPLEMALRDDEGWLWAFLEARLGKTKEKEYLAPKSAPDYLELPTPPGTGSRPTP